MTELPDLVLLTATYPFGNKSETFLESEMEVLARRFRRIFVLPSRREEGVRPLPENAELVEMAWLEEPARGARWRALASPSALRVALATLTGGDPVRPYLRHARMYLDVLARNILKARELGAWVAEHDLRSAVFYDYWFENTTLALALLRRQGTVKYAVCRAHRFDLYDECWEEGVVPFRGFKVAALDVVAPVSDYGVRYLQSRLRTQRDKVRLFHLGVRAQPPTQRTADGETPLVVSCSSMLPLKRVDMIPRVLARLGSAVRWVHLGDGPERPQVEAAARALPEHVSWTLEGHVDNAEVLRFYRENRVDAMISLSVSEGLPVSMMEAISFGVPVVAVGVHGIPELVNDTTGVLLPAEAGVTEVVQALRTVLEPGARDRDEIRSFFLEHYEAGSNYNRFADALIALREAQAPVA